MKLNRFQAFGFHLMGSAAAALLCSALVFLIWYHWPLPVATGVLGVFLLLLAVDVVLGPCMTLIVFNPAKKELRRDLAIILVLQICALLYGMYAVFAARPVYLVFNVDRFDLVYANDLTEEKLHKADDPQFRSVPLLGAQVIAARAPLSPKVRGEMTFSALAGGDDLPQLPEYYLPYAQLKGDVQQHIRPLQELKSFNGGEAATIDELTRQYASVPGGIGFVPLRGKVKDLTVILRKDSAEVLEVKDLRPWKD